MRRPPGYVVLTEMSSEEPVIIHVDQITIAGPAKNRVVGGSTVVIQVGGSFQALESREEIAEQMARASRELGASEADTVYPKGKPSKSAARGAPYSYESDPLTSAPFGKSLCAVCGGSKMVGDSSCPNCTGRGYV